MQVVATRESHPSGGVEVRASVVLGSTQYSASIIIDSHELRYSHDREALINWNERHLGQLLAHQLGDKIITATAKAFKEKH